MVGQTEILTFPVIQNRRVSAVSSSAKRVNIDLKNSGFEEAVFFERTVYDGTISIDALNTSTTAINAAIGTAGSISGNDVSLGSCARKTCCSRRGSFGAQQ